jgi:hypothetical protein
MISHHDTHDISIADEPVCAIVTVLAFISVSQHEWGRDNIDDSDIVSDQYAIKNKTNTLLAFDFHDAEALACRISHDILQEGAISLWHCTEHNLVLRMTFETLVTDYT